MNSARIGFVEARVRLAAKHATELKFKNQVHPSKDKESMRKKKSIPLQMLASKILSMGISNYFDKDNTYNAGSGHDSENPRLIHTPSGRERQRIQVWLYDVEDLLAALDPEDENNTDGDSTISSLNSETTLVPSMDCASSKQEQTRRIQGRMGNVKDVTRELHDDADITAGTLTENGQPMREFLGRYSSYTEC